MTGPISVAVAVVVALLAVLHLPVAASPLLVPVLAFAAIAALVIVVLGLAHRNTNRVRSAIGAIFVLAVAVNGSLRLNHWHAHLVSPECEQRNLLITGYLLGLPFKATNSYADEPRHKIKLRAASISPSFCSGPQLLEIYVAGLSNRQLQPGVMLQLDAQLKRPWRTVNPGALGGEKDYVVRGVHAVGSGHAQSVSGAVSSAQASTVGLRAFRAYIDQGRVRISRWVNESIGEPSNRFLPALLVGDRRSLLAQDRELLQAYGLSHLFVVSGLHVSVAALIGWGLGTVLARLIGTLKPGTAAELLQAQLSNVVALGFALLYTLLAGMSLPTLRAFLMLLFAFLPKMLSRTTSGPDSLAMAGIAVLCMDPTSVLNVSFWLSFSAVGVLLWLSRWRSEHALSLLKAARAQVTIILFMVPMSCLWFGSASTLGALTNFLAIPFMCFYLIPALACSLLLSLISPDVSIAVIKIVTMPLDSLLFLLAESASKWDELLRVNRVLGMPAALSLFLAVLMLPIFRLFRLSLAIVCLVFSVFVPVSVVSRQELRLIFFDVGQGTAVFVEHMGDRLLYDTGGGSPGTRSVAEYAVLPFLRQTGDHLDWLVVSHSDLDHAGGLTAIDASLEIKRKLGSRGVFFDGSECRIGKAFRFGASATMQFLNPQLPLATRNANSCVLRIKAFGRTILLAGDIDDRRERWLTSYWGSSLRADILLIPHHGSNSSSSSLWLKYVEPRLAVVTAGRKNRFGHPTPEVVNRHLASRAGVINTADVGAIEIVLSPNGHFRCQVYRHRWAPIWRGGQQERDCRVPSRSA